MLYQKTLTIPASTSKLIPTTETIKVWRGVIHKIEVVIPTGHVGLAHLQVFLGGHIIMPTNEDGDISGDNIIVPGRFFIELGRDVNVIRLVGWNTDDSYSHSFYVHIGVLPHLILMPQILISKALNALTKLFT